MRWAASAPVRAALAAAGPISSDPDWLHEFARHLLGYVDTVEGELNIREMVEAIGAWDWAYKHHVETRGFRHGGSGNPKRSAYFRGLPIDIPKMLLTRTVQGTRMTFESCAALLSLTTRELEQAMWSMSDIPTMKAAAEAMQADRDMTVADAAERFGLSPWTFADFLRYRYRQLALTANGVLSDPDFAKAKMLVENGVSAREVFNHVIAQKWAPATYQYRSFTRRLRNEGVRLSRQVAA